MRNRARCRLCQEVIESKVMNEWITCKCEEITINGGTELFAAKAKHIENFLRIDDDGNIIVPPVTNNSIPDQKELDITPTQSRKDLLDGLKDIVRTYDNMPPHAMHSFVTNVELQTFMLYVIGIFESE